MWVSCQRCVPLRPAAGCARKGSCERSARDDVRCRGCHGRRCAAATPRGWQAPALLTTATMLAVGLRIYALPRPGYLFGVSEYDDGTDFGSAIRLVHGAVPYHDFIMVQPPGITLIMYPVALITKGMGTITG